MEQVINMEIVGFWDSCFFKHNSEASGVIVIQDGIKKKLTYKEFKKIIEENKNKCQQK